jgi:DNA-binding Lrp family transcriptional regulator
VADPGAGRRLREVRVVHGNLGPGREQEHPVHTAHGGGEATRVAEAPTTETPRRPLTEADDALLAALQRDGRAPLTELAAAVGRSQATVARRIAELRACGAIFFDVEVDNRLFGVTTQALLWMSVAPARLDETAIALAEHPELAFVVATTGTSNLVAQAMCPDTAALHHYLTRRLGTFDAIRTMETTPILTTVKATGRLTPETAQTTRTRRPRA